MDAKAVHDPGYFQRLHRDQPLYICEHYLTSAGNMLEMFRVLETPVLFVLSWLGNGF